MANSDPLVAFGFAIIIFVGGLIIIPYLRGRSDLLTAWNTLLLGLIVFTAVGSIEVKYVTTMGWEQLDWFQPTAQEVQWYMAATTAFIATLVTAYYLNSPAKRFAQKRFQKWPELTVPLVFFVLAFCFIVTVMSIVCRTVTFIGPVMFNLAYIGAPAGCVFSFALWNRNRLNIGWLLLFLGVFLSTGIYAMVVSGGRRLLLSLFLVPVLYAYWGQIRYWRPTRAIVAVAIAGVMILGVSVVYAKFRWYNLATKERRTVGGVVQQVRELRSRGDIFSMFLRNRLDYLAQSNGHFALLTQRYVSSRVLTPVPLNSLRFLLAYPVPHNVWSRKPEVIGLTLVRDVAHIPGTNWGLGIAGQGAYEGGIPALMLYAILLAFGMRCLDEPMRMQPGNPFLVYLHASALPHVAGIPRGDMGVMTKEVIQCAVFTLVLGLTCRFIFGTRSTALTVPSSGATTWRGHPAIQPQSGRS